jgi:hypothetical protein
MALIGGTGELLMIPFPVAAAPFVAARSVWRVANDLGARARP